VRRAARTAQTPRTLIRKPKRKRESLSRCRREAPHAAGKRAARANRLALIRAFCAAVGPLTRPRRRSVHNFFAMVNPPMPTAIVPTKTRTNGERCARSPRDAAKCDVAETSVSSALLYRLEFLVGDRAGEKFFVRAFRRRSRRRCGWPRGAAVTHNIKRSHCYFFPAVVIGW